jgi:hypothetical protein
MRGAAAGGTAGLGAGVAAGAELTGAAGAETGGACTGAAATGRAAVGGGVDTCGVGGATIGRAGTGAGGAAAGADTTGFGAVGGAAAGRVTAGGATFSAGAGGTGFSVIGCGGTAGRGVTGGAAAASLRCVIAFSTSPGRAMCDKSILVLISSSPRTAREEDLPAAAEPSPEERRYTRTFSASCSSRELEWVFFSVIPTCGSASRIALLLTSSSRARSLMRTLLIRPFISPCCV